MEVGRKEAGRDTHHLNRFLGVPDLPPFEALDMSWTHTALRYELLVSLNSAPARRRKTILWVSQIFPLSRCYVILQQKQLLGEGASIF
jgi:hypothetical protein